MAPGIPTLDPDRESLQTLREFWFVTLARLISEAPLTAVHVAAYQAFGIKLDAKTAKETQLRDAIALADAEAVAADRVLNTLLDRLATLIHGNKQVDVTLPKHQMYLGNDTPYEAARPILGPQLDLMESWPNKLAKETAQPFLDMIAPVQTAVNVGKAARQKTKDTRAANAEFRLTERRQLFDEYNALATNTFGALGAYAHDHPELKLPAGWASSCFRHVSRDQGPQTVEEIDEIKKKLLLQIEELDKKRAALVEEAANRAAAAQDAAAAAVELEKAEQAEQTAKKQKKEAAERAKAAKKKLKK